MMSLTAETFLVAWHVPTSKLLAATVAGTLKLAIDKIDAMQGMRDLMLHTEDIT